ncbi:MAG: hypothetical protein A2Z25_23095 [Planctomycetes bacterium RBG_16_55_9]|nr:MAG: hypothetical protein A2Z25_23095 [Planctomycetes bacterium RBG_16_55_9]
MVRRAARIVRAQVDRYGVEERIMSMKKARAIFHLSLFILVASALATNRHVNVLNGVCAKELRNETGRDKQLVEITLKLEGKTVPGKPKVVSAQNTFDALFEKTSGASSVSAKAGENTWTCYAVEDEEYVIGWIAEKSWFAKKSRMFGYCSEPFIAHAGRTVEFSPGMPATFEYDLRNPPEGIETFPAEVILHRETIKNHKRTFLSWGGQQKIERPSVLKISGLAGGTYKISARACDIQLNARTPALCEDCEVEIKPGLANRFDPNYPQIDSTVEAGDVTIRGTLYGPDKKPLANRIVHVIPLTSHGYDLSLYYPASTTDSNGRFEFVGVRPNRLVYVSSENTSVNLGKQSLVENASVSVDIVLGLKKLPVAVGKPLEEIVIDWKGGDTRRLSDLAGKIVVLDIWATWCAPCLRALPELNSLATKVSAGSNIVFVALSVDHDKAIWERVVEESNWKALKHGVLDRTKNSYVFDRPIPYTMVIDEIGVVRAEGHGLDIGLELNKLAKTSGQPGAGTPGRSPEK